jgi:hypothetical protein
MYVWMERRTILESINKYVDNYIDNLNGKTYIKKRK